jgi:hypothetical protein
MVIGSKFPANQIVSAHFAAIKYGLQNDIVDSRHIIFYGDGDKATLVTAKYGGKVVGVKSKVRRRRGF